MDLIAGYADEEEEMNEEKGVQGRKRAREANTEEAERTVKKQKPETESNEADLTLPDDFDSVDKSQSPRSLPSEPPTRVVPKSNHKTPPKKKGLVPPQLRGARNVVTEDYESWTVTKSKTKQKDT